MSKPALESISFMFGRVWHARHRPVTNAFRYPVSYLALPLSRLEQFSRGPLFGLNRWAPISLHMKDYGSRGAKSSRDWVEDQLRGAQIEPCGGEIVLLAMPRFMGYVFNPVCFWLCYNQENQLTSVVTEVNNTFGQTHIYVCANEEGSSIDDSAEIWAYKEFHVSPFFKRTGGYRFRFDFRNAKVNISIDYFSEEGVKLLSTQLSGSLSPDCKRSRIKMLTHAPAISLLSTWQIYWQAIKLKTKGMPWIPKPDVIKPNLTTATKRSLDKIEG